MVKDLRIAVDIGGTFTDVVLEDDARRLTRKLLTTPQRPEEAVLDGVRLILGDAGRSFGDVDVFVHGTTLATNAVIERRRTGLRRATLLRAAEIYQARFAGPDGRIPATFQVVTLTGWAPHESQQKPLRPGSARTRLADALGTTEIATGDKTGPDRPKRV